MKLIDWRREMLELIRNATIEDYKRGYQWDAKKAQFFCLICERYINQEDDNLNVHMESHGSPLERLLILDKKYTGLTEIQKEFLDMVSNKYNDKEIALKLGCAESTVRNTRFALRERARQARAFLAVMELAEEDMPKTAIPRLRVFPVREEKRKALLPRFADLFEPDKAYTEAEVKKIIQTIYEDDATIRRYLVDYGYLARPNDGSKYYKNSKENIMSDINKKEIKDNYKLQEVEMGIIQIYNKVNGYSFVDTCTNLYKPFESIKFQLNLGKTKSKELKEDWKEYGEDAFEFKVVEKLKPKEGASEKEKLEELKELLKLWVEGEGEKLKLYK